MTRSAPLPLSPQERAIVSAIVRGGPMSRADLARRLGRSRSSLWSEIAGLIDRGVLLVESRGESTGGRKGELLETGGSEVGLLAGVDIDSDRASVSITTLAAEVLAQKNLPRISTTDPGATLEAIAAALDRQLGQVDGPLLGVGISIAAQIDPATSRPMSPPTMPTWADWPVCEFFSDRYGVRAFIDNDVNVLALAEAIAPQAEPHIGSSFLLLKISSGFGCGVVVDGAVFRGDAGFAGDIGHICVDRNDETPCSCGNTGCLEVLASVPAIIRDAYALAADSASPMLERELAEHGSLDLETVDRASAAGDAAVGALLRKIGNRIGFVLAGIVSFFNPSTVMVSSGLSGGEDILLNAIRELIYQRALPASTRSLRVTGPNLRAAGASLSAAVLAREGYLGTAGSVAQTRPRPS